MRRYSISSALVLLLLVGLLGCDLSPPLMPLDAASSPSPSAATGGTVVPTPTPTASPSASPTPSPTPAIRALRGYVIDRTGQRLPGAKVTLGTLVTSTADTGGTAVDETGQTASLQAGDFILLNVPAGAQTVTLAYDGASRSVPVTVQASGVTQADALYLPVYGPVPSGSKALVASTATGMIEVQKASSSAPLVFMPDRVTVQLKAPPNGAGDTVGAYAFTYLRAGDATMSPTITWALPSVVVFPAPGANESGQGVDISALIKNTSNSLQSGWDFETPNATLQIAFLRTVDGPPLLDRDGQPLVVRVNCLLVP